MVFKNLGEGVLSNAWKGYNCSLFAYGQTGSGKSYSMVGYGMNKGKIKSILDIFFLQSVIFSCAYLHLQLCSLK